MKVFNLKIIVKYNYKDIINNYYVKEDKKMGIMYIPLLYLILIEVLGLVKIRRIYGIIQLLNFFVNK